MTGRSSNSARRRAFREIRHRPFCTEEDHRTVNGHEAEDSIAISPIHNPPVVIFDEPTNGLDILTAPGHGLLKRAQGERASILLSTHIFSVAEDLCDEIRHYHRGRVVALGSIAALKETTGTQSFEDAFSACIPRITRSNKAMFRAVWAIARKSTTGGSRLKTEMSKASTDAFLLPVFCVDARKLRYSDSFFQSEPENNYVMLVTSPESF